MNMKLIWKDVFASKTENGLDVHFEKLGNEFFSLYQRRISAQTDKSQRTKDHLNAYKDGGKHIRTVGIHIQPHGCNKQVKNTNKNVPSITRTEKSRQE